MTNKKLISIIFPIHNEENNIPILCQQVKKLWQDLKNEYKYEIVFVDDGSSDDSWQQIKQLKKSDKSIVGFHFSRNFGHQAAIEAGLNYAQGDAVVMLDADGQHPIKVIKILISKWEEGYEIINTIRKDSDDVSRVRRAIPRIMYSTINKLSEMKITPGAADFRLIDRKVVNILKRLPEQSKFYRGLINWVGFKSTFIEFNAGKRKHGKSSYTFKKLYRLAVDGLTSFSNFPLKAAKLIGFSVFALAFAGILIMLILAVTDVVSFPLWQYFFAAIVLLMGAQFLVIWFIGSYIGRIFSQQQGRPNYIISEEI